MNYITRRRGKQLLDRLARRYLNMSGEEFLRRYDAGEIEDPSSTDFMRVAMMIPLARPKRRGEAARD